MGKEKVVVFGTGRASEHFVLADFNKELFELVAFADNDEKKQGTVFLGKKVLAPSQLHNYAFDSIIIASNFYDEISDGLEEKYHIPKQILHNRHYREIEQIQKRYQRYYKNKEELYQSRESIKLSNDEPIVIYTAITGGFDQLREPEMIDGHCKYICFTDRNDLESDIWEIRKIDIEDGDYNRTAKKFKVLPHKYFPEYNWSIWIDGQLQITGDLRSLIRSYNKKAHMLCFLHQVRTRILDEARVCKELGFDDGKVIDNQVHMIQQSGYKDDNELIAGGILLRQHNQKDVIQTMEDWWKIICEYSRRDQLSFNYVAWKNNFMFDITDLNIMDNQYFKRFAHEKVR